MEKKDFEKYIQANSNIVISIAKNAEFIHNEVNQKYDDKPYFVHLSSVAHYVEVYGHNVCENENDILPLIFGAYFHDSIEDARLTYNDVTAIARKYMTNQQAYLAAEIVYALTNEKGRNRATRANDKYYSGIRETPLDRDKLMEDMRQFDEKLKLDRERLALDKEKVKGDLNIKRESLNKRNEKV